MTTLTSCSSHDITCDTGECLWLHLDLIKSMLTFCNNLFPVTSYAYCTIPTYPSGQIGFVLCSKNPVNTHASRGSSLRALNAVFFQETNFREPVRLLSDDDVSEMKLRYYNSDVHRAAFVLPQFAKKVRRFSRLVLSSTSARVFRVVYIQEYIMNA